jgi:hypothetical protein
MIRVNLEFEEICRGAMNDDALEICNCTADVDVLGALVLVRMERFEE